MRIQPLLAALLLASGGPSLFAQDRLPVDWDQKVLAVVKDPERARKVSEAGRQSEVGRQQAIAAVRKAREKLGEVFLSRTSEAVDRQISLSTFRDDRRNAAFLWIDPIYGVGNLVTKKEWRAIWPEGFFAFPPPAPSAAGEIHAMLPSVVSDPARQRQAMDVTASLVKAAETNEASRMRETSRLQKLLEEGSIPRDECIGEMDKLEQAQAKTDDELIRGSIRLQKILTPDEWATMVRGLKAQAR